MNRKHDPVAELVVDAPFALAQHAGLLQQLQFCIIRAQLADQRIPASRGVADAEAGGDIAGQAPLFQVINSLRRLLQL